MNLHKTQAALNLMNSALNEGGLHCKATRQALIDAKFELAELQMDFSDLVESYLARSSIGENYFGVKACGNSNFVKRLRDGGKFHYETVMAVRQYIADNQSQEPKK